ncbi:MAG: DNA (cytosine-5-)-methyltransferase [Oscillibacter sp.]|nr:DNA (cytosine-5-)-methyltransferase [Oscillibacter sp.]
MTHGSLFSGIGGFDIAAEWAGIENLFHCEWNPFCRQVLKHHFPNSESYEDITKTDFTKWRGKIDILTGGFPCQPFSVAGSRKGADDDRYLWPEMLRAVGEIRPTWVIGENVAGILSMVLPGEEINMGMYQDITGESYTEIEERQMYIIERICQDFENIGYSVQPIIVPACAVGAPHRRDRIWFVAHCSDARSKTERSRGNEIYAAGVTTNPILRGCERRTSEAQRKREQVHTGERVFREIKRHGKLRTTSDPDSTRRPKQHAAEKSSKPSCKRRKRSNSKMPTWENSQLNPLFVTEMMGFPLGWLVSPFQNGDKNQ